MSSIDPEQNSKPTEEKTVLSSPFGEDKLMDSEKGEMVNVDRDGQSSGVALTKATSVISEPSFRPSKGRTDKVSVDFFQSFATLVFLAGISLGFGGAFVTRTEVIRTVENGKVVQEVQRIIPGDRLIQSTGFGMAGLAAGSIFFNYAPGLVKGVLQIVGGAVSGAATAINQTAKQKDEEE